MLLPGFMVSKFLISIDAFVLYGFWFYGILSLSLSMCSGTQYPMPCALVTREFIFIILFKKNCFGHQLFDKMLDCHVQWIIVPVRILTWFVCFVDS